MPIPPFDERGVLGIPDSSSGKPGRVMYSQLALVPVSLAEIHARFVLETPDFAHRAELWQGWMEFRREFERFGVAYHTWLGGSFLTTKTHPGDIDLCLIFEGADYGLLPRDEQDAFAEVVNRTRGKARFHCELLTIVNFPVSHHRFIQSSLGYNYWTRVFGVDRAGNQVSMLIVSERGVYE
jgi:hypothetical protein